MQNALALHVLRLMFEETQKSLPPSQIRLATLLDATLDEIADALRELEAEGLADARRARLTFAGLAVAVARFSFRRKPPVRRLAA